MNKENSNDKQKDHFFSVVKPTFSAVYSTQELLRVFLEQLIEENRPLSPDERKHYYDLFASSTLGLGVGRDFHIYLDRIYQYGNLESVGRWLGQQKEKRVCIPADMGMPSSETVDIGIFWAKLLDELFYVFPLALDRAISMSKESIDISQHQHTRGAKVGSKI